MSIKSYFTVFFVILLLTAGVLGIKSIVEMTQKIDDCIRSTNYTDVNNKNQYYANDAHTENIGKNEALRKLCGCIKFSEITKTDNCLIMRDGNRILVVSLRYSSPVFYQYSCSPKRIHYTEKECADKARMLISFIVPDEFSGAGIPDVMDYYSEGNIETVRLYFPGNIKKLVIVRIRRDTCNPIYFDARQFYGKL